MYIYVVYGRMGTFDFISGALKPLAITPWLHYGSLWAPLKQLVDHCAPFGKP